jgi:serine/threonine protein kinase
LTRLADETIRHLRRVATWPDTSGTRYTIVREIGRGGMGTVYLATDGALGREVALKVANSAAAHPRREARMRREVHILAQLEHPGIVPVHDVGTLADGRLFYVMKLVRGRTLGEHLRDVQSRAERLRLFERLLEPVSFAHARGTVHRDLKPENVMIGSFGEVLVVDWGVAKLLGAPEVVEPATAAPPESYPETTDPGTVMGTPGFMPPEQSGGQLEAVDRRADVYALGAMLFVLLAGDSPPADPSAVPIELARHRDVDRRLRAVCAKAMAPDPASRYADAAALGADLARYREGAAVTAYPETALDRLARLVVRYRVPLLLVLAYLVMRALVALTLG